MFSANGVAPVSEQVGTLFCRKRRGQLKWRQRTTFLPC